jgi:hippurate hydrolase
VLAQRRQLDRHHVELIVQILAKTPGCYFLIGNGDGTHREHGHGLGPCNLHNPTYDFNDQLLPVGASMWRTLVKAWFDETQG